MLSAAREVAWTVPLTSRDGHQREGEQHKEVPFGGRARHHYAGAAASSKLSQLGARTMFQLNTRAARPPKHAATRPTKPALSLGDSSHGAPRAAPAGYRHT